MEGNKNCYNCYYYKPYYTKGYLQFDRCDIGKCMKRKETVDKHDTCECYVRNSYPSFNKKTVALMAIKGHIDLLAELKQILEEDDEELLEDLLRQVKNQKKKRKS